MSRGPLWSLGVRKTDCCSGTTGAITYKVVVQVQTGVVAAKGIRRMDAGGHWRFLRGHRRHRGVPLCCITTVRVRRPSIGGGSHGSVGTVLSHCACSSSRHLALAARLDLKAGFADSVATVRTQKVAATVQIGFRVYLDSRISFTAGSEIPSGSRSQMDLQMTKGRKKTKTERTTAKQNFALAEERKEGTSERDRQRGRESGQRRASLQTVSWTFTTARDRQSCSPPRG